MEAADEAAPAPAPHRSGRKNNAAAADAAREAEGKAAEAADAPPASSTPEDTDGSSRRTGRHRRAPSHMRNAAAGRCAGDRTLRVRGSVADRMARTAGTANAAHRAKTQRTRSRSPASAPATMRRPRQQRGTGESRIMLPLTFPRRGLPGSAPAKTRARAKSAPAGRAGLVAAPTGSARSALAGSSPLLAWPGECCPSGKLRDASFVLLCKKSESFIPGPRDAREGHC